MSYNGTVYCRYCYEKGHNKRTCPQWTERIKERAMGEIKSGEGYDGYWGRMWLKRPPARTEGLYADGTSIPAEKKKTTKQKRVCKYCGKSGHNRRTCPQLKADKADTVIYTGDLRRRLIAAMKDAGLGVGSIVAWDVYGERRGYMVTGFVNEAQLHSDSVRHNQDFLKCKALHTKNVSRWDLEKTIGLPALENIPELENAWSRLEIVAPVSAEQVEAGLPEGWVENMSFLDRLYSERQADNYYENRNNY